MAGAFVTLPAADGFLPNSEGAKGLNDGAIVTVRITRAALGGKGPRLSARDTEAVGSDKTLGLLRRGIDPLRELAARYPAAEVLVDDPAFAASLRPDLGDRLRRVAEAFDDGIETEVEGLASAEVLLASGVRLCICPTPALVAIDVDAGAALAGRNRASRHHLSLKSVGVA